MKPAAQVIAKITQQWGNICYNYDRIVKTATGICPPIRDIETIKTLVREVDGPVNVVMGLAGTPISLADLKQAGVARVSIGGSMARATLDLVRRAAREMLEQGSFDFSHQQIADAKLCRFFSKADSGN